MKNIREKLLQFVNSDTEYPVLAALIFGFYVFLFYYSNNFNLASSWQQLLFFSCYFMLLPMVVSYISYKIILQTRFKGYVRQCLFILLLSFLGYFVLQNFGFVTAYRKAFLLFFIVLSAISFRFKNYKIIVVIVGLMSIYPAFLNAGEILSRLSSRNDWYQQPDAIESVQFRKKPNVYYIQVDGYANANTLKNSLYRFDNSAFERWLKDQNFKIYDDFSSNYPATLESNSSCFNMKHHFMKPISGFKNKRDFILSDNAALRTFKSNGYRTFFISERPYLLMNRPNVAFDYCNFSASDLPFLQDGWEVYRDITGGIKQQILSNKATSNFFFIEKFDPGHIAVQKAASEGKEAERKKYLRKLEIANQWLTEIVSFINVNDKNAIVIIGADHAGFVGFNYALESEDRITNHELLQSMYGASLAIRWNNSEFQKYDRDLKSSVNLFRTLFSFLSAEPKYLLKLQPNDRYNVDSAGNFYKVNEPSTNQDIFAQPSDNHVLSQ